MKNVKKIISCFCALTVIAGVVFPNAVFADTKSDATASIQFTSANRLKLRTSLKATNLSPKDVMATNYVLEDFNEWSTDCATMAGATYPDYSGGWEARAKAKIGGTRASADVISLPVTGLGTYGQFGGGNQFLVNLLKITSTESKNQATVGWFGSTTDGYYGFKNTGGAKKIIDTTPTGTVSGTGTPVYTSTTDSLLYVGDTDRDTINDIDDWMNFQGQIVVSYDWLVSPVSTDTKEIMTLDNIAVHYSRTSKDGTSKENQNVGDFPITGLPIVYYDTKSSSVKMRSHAGIDFSKNNPNYYYYEKESDPKRLLPWKLANDEKYFNTLDISGINKGDWVNLTVVLDVQGTNSSNRVISQREFLNGELVKNANGESVCTIKPYDTEYIISTTSSKPGAPESCSLEGYPYSGKWANWAPAEYYGIGVSFSNGQASDGWGGIDNLCYRVYNGTKLDKTEYSGSDISNGNLEIGFSTNTGLTSSQLSVAPKIATSGIVDMGNDADIKIVKTNVANDPLILAGQETSASVTKLNNIDMTNYTYQGTVTGKKYLDGTAVRISGLDNLSGDDAYVVSIDTKDATEKPFRENVICTDSQNVGFIGTTLLDFLGNDVTSEASLISARQYSIPRDANEFVLYSTDETAQTVTIEGNGNTYNATFLNGKYTVSLGSLLSQNTQYLIKKNGTEVASFVPSEGGFTYEAYKNSSGKPAIRYANATNDSISGFLIAYNSQTDLKAMGVSIPAGGFGEQSMTVSDNYDNVLFVKSLKLGNNESERNSDKADMTPFVSASSTLSGNLTEKDKDVMLVVIKGDSWANDTEISNSIVYIDFDVTKDEPPVTVDGTSHKKGDYEFDITFPAGFTTGKYTFMVYSDDSAYKRVVAYGKDTDNLSAIETFKTSPQTAIGSETTRDSLEFYYDEVEKKYQPAELSAFYNSVATILANELAINPLPAEQGAAKAKAIELYRQAAIAKGVADGKVTDLDKVSDDISILSSGVLSGYWKGNTGVKDSKKSTWKTDVTSRLAGKTFKTVSTPLVAPVSSETETATSFEKALTEAVILQVVEDAESVDAAKNVMQNTFAGLNTLTQSTVISYTAGTVMNQDFDTFDALQDALTEANQAGVAPPPVNNDNPGNRGGNLGNVGVESDSKKPQETEKESEPEQEEKYSFSDMASAPWADEAVKTLKEMGVVNGKTETEFAPSDNVTREEFVKMIVLLADINVEHGDVEFSDVKESDWYYKSIKAAAQKNIINGISEKEFGVGRKITRQDMAVITANVLSYLNISVSKKNLEFSDAELISDYAKDAISKLTAKGIINGYDDNTFKPNGFATRAEAAKILYGILPLLK